MGVATLLETTIITFLPVTLLEAAVVTVHRRLLVLLVIAVVTLGTDAEKLSQVDSTEIALFCLFVIQAGKKISIR